MLPDLYVIVPTRGRPQACGELIETFAATCTAKTFLCFAVDEDDPDRFVVRDLCDGKTSGVHLTHSHTMVEALNEAAMAPYGNPDALGFMGDDHRPRTVGWDTAYLEELRRLGTGIVYGDDLFQGHKLPTQCAMTTDIVGALGYMAPPTLRHMYVDNFWVSLGQAAGCIRYLPNVVVEHVHPFTGKVEWDEGHIRVNSQEMYDHDERAYNDYLTTDQFVNDVAKVRDLVKVKA